jgi:DNA-binding response OmpR family regulator
VTTVLLATDSDSIFADVDAALASSSVSVLRVRAGRDVVPVTADRQPDLVIIDLQIGNMGGIAACIAVRQEEGAGRLERRPVALLLDRSADVFLAQESGAEGWLVKPLDALRLRRLQTRLLAGEPLHEGLDPTAATMPEAGSQALT